MKTHHAIMLAMLTCIFFWTAINLFERHSNQKEIIQRFDHLDSMLVKLDTSLGRRDYLDSLTYNHLKQCSFIMRDDVIVGSRGVLYSNYHRKYTNP